MLLNIITLSLIIISLNLNGMPDYSQNIDALNQLLFSEEENHQILALNWIEQDKRLIKAMQYSLCLRAYLGESYREAIEDKAHQLLTHALSKNALVQLQDCIIILDYARYKFKVPEGWCSYQNPLRNYLKRHEQALPELQPVFNYIPKTISKLYTLLAGRIQQEWEHYKKALQYYKKALALHPSNSQAQFGYAMIIHTHYIKKGLRWEETEQLLNYYMNAYKGPKNINSYRNAAMLCQDVADIDRSAAYFKAGLRACPNDTSLLNNYANLLMKHQKNFDKARILAAKGLKIAPLDCSLLDTMAHIEMNGFGAIERAKSLFEKALKIDKDLHYVHTGLGDLYLRCHQVEQAKKHYQKGLHNGLQYCTREIPELIEKLEKIIHFYRHSYGDNSSAEWYEQKLQRLRKSRPNNTIKKG